MSAAELGLLGHLIGDGCTLPAHSIQYTTKDPTLAEEVAALAKAVFGGSVRPRIQHERTWIQVYLPAARHLTHGIRNPVCTWLGDLGVFGLRSHEKRVPQKVFQQSVNGVACFLRHLWATDGCVHASHGIGDNPRIYYASSSRQLAEDVQSLLLRIGINARLSTHSQESKGRDQHHVTVSGKHDVLAFLQTVGVLGESKKRHAAAILEHLSTKREMVNRDAAPLFASLEDTLPAKLQSGMTTQLTQTSVDVSELGGLDVSDVFWDQLKSIVADGIEEVYDLTVQDLHNFVSGNVIVHNSIEQDADVVMFLFRPEYYKSDEKPGIAEVHVAKHRNGPTGTIELKFRRDHTRFYNLETRRPEPGTE
jgi:replicative DNA helicase